MVVFQTRGKRYNEYGILARRLLWNCAFSWPTSKSLGPLAIDLVNICGLLAVRPQMRASRGAYGGGRLLRETVNLMPWVSLALSAHSLNSFPALESPLAPINQGSTMKVSNANGHLWCNQPSTRGVWTMARREPMVHECGGCVQAGMASLVWFFFRTAFRKRSRKSTKQPPDCKFRAFLSVTKHSRGKYQ